MKRRLGFRFLLGGILRGCLSLACIAACARPAVAQAESRSSPNPPSQRAQSSPTQDSPDVITLELGKPVERELSGGQKHFYQVVLSQGQYARLEMKENGANIAWVFQRPDGQTINEWTPYVPYAKVLAIPQVAETSGIYRLEIHTFAKAAPGRYQLRLAELRPATENDRALQEANTLMSEYMRVRDQGKWPEAKALILRVLAIREKALGPDDRLLATTLSFVANSFDDDGDYAAAEAYDLQAVKILEKALGPDHPDMALELMHLGNDSRARGSLVRAEEMQQKAWAILEKGNLTETPMAAGVLEGLGNVRNDQSDYVGAENYYSKSRAVWEKLLGPDSFHLSFSYTFSGNVAYQQGDYEKAEAMFQHALSLAEKGLGAENLKVTPYVNDLAMVYCTTGAFGKGEGLYRRVITQHEQKAAMSYPDVQTALFGLARCLEAEGNWPEAVKLQSRASEITERYVAINIAIGSEREKQSFLDDLSLRASRNISVQTQFARNDPSALRLALTTVLQNKGRVQDAVSSSLSALRQRFGPEDQKLLDQLNDLSSQLANLVLNGPQRSSPAEYAQKIRTLEEQREQLEDQMNRRTAGFYQAPKTVTFGGIQAAVPGDAALVEFAVYRPFNPKAPDNAKAYGTPHYVVYVVRNQGEVQWTDLGEAWAIDEAVDRLRQALRDPQRKDVQQLGRALDRDVMQTIRTLAGDARHLLISPDGELNLIPFEALVDEQGRYLVESYAINYLTTGRDLLRMQVTRESKSKPVVVADPFFGEPQLAQAAGAVPARLKPASVAERRRSVIAAEDLSGVYFAPLTGTAQEARVIQSLFPESRVLTGTQATKSALQGLIAPRILHIATHGFFLQDAGAEKAGAWSGRPTAFKIEEPLLRSGLALSGANLNHGSSGRDGILTALEASNLNLWGTKLVTLSACETGVGEVRNGEGVYGLRRAFFLAGTETLVMSLWPVSDRVTREMMTAYYTGLKRGLGRGDALRQAELAMLKRKDRQHPFYWAGFIHSGEWADFDGRR
jgi:CHAT domain-containing protein